MTHKFLLTRMDSYFPKTRKPITSANLSNPLKRPPPSVTPPRAAKIPATPSTPKDARITRPLQPPPVKKKQQLRQDDKQQAARDALAARMQQYSPKKDLSKRPITVRELFKSVHPHDKSPTSTSTSTTSTTLTTRKTTDITTHTPPTAYPINSKLATPLEPNSPSKITSGPLKGVSTSLLDLIRAKEAAAKAITPEDEKKRDLLGIAPEIVRIVPTVFTASKKEILPYDRVVDKCFKGLKSNYTSQTIVECLDLLDKVAPLWVSTVQISRGKFMKINRDKYTIPQLLESIKRYKRSIGLNY